MLKRFRIGQGVAVLHGLAVDHVANGQFHDLAAQGAGMSGT